MIIFFFLTKEVQEESGRERRGSIYFHDNDLEFGARFPSFLKQGNMLKIVKVYNMTSSSREGSKVRPPAKERQMKGRLVSFVTGNKCESHGKSRDRLFLVF